MTIETALISIGTLAGLAYAIYLGYDAKHKTQIAEAKAEAFAASQQADKAKSDYVELLEKRIDLQETINKDLMIRLTNAEAEQRKIANAEEVCQKERVELLGEVGRMQRALKRAGIELDA